MYGDAEQLQKALARPAANKANMQRLLQVRTEPKDEDNRVNKKPNSGKCVELGKQTLDTTEDQQRFLFDDPMSQDHGQPVLIHNGRYNTQTRLDSNMSGNNMTVSPQYVTVAVIEPSEFEFRGFYFANGDHYRGYCLRGQSIPHGQGVKTSGSLVYEGNYKHGLYHGFGKITFQLPLYMENPLISYEGGFRDGYYQGEGMATYRVPATSAVSLPDFFVRYIGGWSWGEKNGHGTMLYFSGAQYDGGWKHDVPHGQGTLIWADRYYYYDGGWKDGKKSGYGILISGDGSRYEGGWLDDNKSGLGINTKIVEYDVESQN